MEYLLEDALTTVSHFFKSTLESLDDHCLLILADNRYTNSQYQSLLPKWLTNQLLPDNDDLPVDQALNKVL